MPDAILYIAIGVSYGICSFLLAVLVGKAAGLNKRRDW